MKLLLHQTPLTAAGLILALAPLAPAQVGDVFCVGEVCPCGNLDLTAGCGSLGLDGDPSTGVALTGASGSANVAADDLVVSMAGVAPGQFAVLLVSASTQDSPFGDGRLCLGSAGGGRLAPTAASAGGNVSYERIVSSVAAGGLGPAAPGATLYFQGLYRDPGGPCGSSFNLTSALAVTFEEGPIEAELAAVALDEAPWVDRVQAFNEGDAIHLGLDPRRSPQLLGASVEVYLVEARDAAGWDADPQLVDARGAATPYTVTGLDLETNVVAIDAGTLPGPDPTSTAMGRGYDVVVDVDLDGQLSPGDLIDGRGDGAGLTVFRDIEKPGPYGVTEVLWSGGGSFEGQDIYFPDVVASLPSVPLVVVSHGNGHNYQWYDHIGFHLASYGYVVMSHQNNTQPGPQAASLTTLANVDLFLGNLDVIAGGALQGKVDASRMAWFGHSRGGEGVVRAYDRMVDGNYVPQNFVPEDIALISSIAPTNFLGASGADPHGVNYHLWTGSADADVNGGPSQDVIQTYQLLERAEGIHASITLQGVGHGAFHDGGGSNVADGPCLVGRVKTHKLMRGVILPLVRHFVEEEEGARDWLWRSWDTLQPIGAPSVQTECFVNAFEFDGEPGTVVLEDFQTEPDTGTSSRGTEVTFDVLELVEGLLDDADSSFGWLSTDPMNGMTRAGTGDDTRGVVFEWDSPSFYRVALPDGERNLAAGTPRYLSFRVCQATRHPLTVAALEPLGFDVVLEDSSGREARIAVDAYGHGVNEPYQRVGAGSGAGWHNEFETFRLRLDDFESAEPELALHDIVAVRFDFATSPGSSPVGRIGLDDLCLAP